MPALIIVFISLFLISSSVKADIIRLKNGNDIEGIVVEETPSEVTIDLGMGTMTIGKNEIKSIGKAAGEEKTKQLETLRIKEIERGEFIPAGLNGLSDKFQELKRNKKELDSAKGRLEGLKEKFELRKENLRLLTAEFNTKNELLKNLNPSADVAYYNKIVAEVNAVNAKLASLSYELNDISEKLPVYGKAVQSAVMSYENNIERCKKNLEEELKNSGKRQLTEDEDRFFETVGNSLAKLEKTLKKDSISLAESSGNLIAEVRINGKLNCVMIVDTGASVVTITRDAAIKLGLGTGDERDKIEATLADGSKVKAEAVILSTVEVGESKAKNVLAAIMDKPPAPGVDGLLGLSFLENFGVKIDSANKKLILESIAEN